jgi:hypothetical protein
VPLDVQLWDLKRRRQVRAPRFDSRFDGNPRVADLELRSTGSFALTLRGEGTSTTEVWLVPPRGHVRLLDHGYRIDATSLVREGRTVVWTNAGTQRRARLP